MCLYFSQLYVSGCLLLYLNISYNCDFFSIVVKKRPEVIIFILLHIIFILLLLDDSFFCLQIVACFPTTYRFYGNPCHLCYTYIAIELSRICQLCKLCKSKFFRLYPLLFYFIAYLLDSHLNLSLYFFFFILFFVRFC